MVIPSDYFGGNGDGGAAMEEWLRKQCPGCRHSSRKGEREDHQGGLGCDLPVNAYVWPHQDIEEWSPDAGNQPGELTCMAREERPPSPFKGRRRGSRQAQGQEAML